MSRHPEVTFIILGAVAAIGVVAWYFSKDARTKRALRKIRPTAVRDAVEGKTIKVVGRVRFVGPPLEAPLSGRICAQYRLTVTQQQGRSSSTIVQEEKAVDFLIEDATGRALVRMASATVAVNMDSSANSGMFRDASPRMETLLQRHGKTSQGWVFNKSLRYSEGVLEENEEVAVFGRARLELDPDPSTSSMGGSYREAPRRLVIDVRPEGPVLISDDKSVLG